MALRIINQHIAQAWLPSGFVVVRTSHSDEHVIAGAATCVMRTKNWVWLASSTAFLRRVRLPTEAVLPLDLEENFLSSLFEADSFPHSDLAISLDVGDLYSISSATIASSNEDSRGRCVCVLEVFGVKGYVMVGAHDGTIRESSSFNWQNVTDGVAFVHTIRQGPLRNAIVQPGFSSPAIIVFSATGSIRVTAGSSYFNIHSHMANGSGFKEVANMSQTPVWQASDSGNNFVIVLGQFRAGVVLFPNRDGAMCASRFILKGGVERLTQYSITIVEEESGRLVVEEVATGHRTGIVIDRENSNVDIDLDWGRKQLPGNGQVHDEDQSSTLRSLLQGIETLGEREKLHDTDCRSIEDLISSYNAAFLFVSEWKENKTTVNSMDVDQDSCKISVDFVNVGGSPRLQLPNPLVGKEIFLTVSFRNNTGIGLSDGWMLRMRLRREAESELHQQSQGASVKISDDLSEKADLRTTRVMTCPVKKVEPGATSSVSFPVVIDSHRPLYISVALAFHHPAAFALSEEHVDIEVGLLDDIVIDILHLAARTTNRDIKDSSHELLASSQVMALFNHELVEKQRGYPTVSRFEVPFCSQDVREVVGMKEPSASFETPLGAQFTVSVADVALRDESKTGQVPACSVALRGVPHVLPFLRAAVLRRLLDAVSQDSLSLRRIVVRDSTKIRHWQKSLVNNADECLPSMRTAETKLVEALRVYRETDEESVELCFDGQERDAMLSALQSAKSTYGMWRRENEHLWTPKGATYVVKKRELP